jgi:hypothetical protein
MTDPSLVQQVLDRCQDALFTGTVRVRTRQAEGEIWLLSGILERVRFGTSVDDEAMGRLLAADTPRVEAVPCLPNPNGGFKKGHPMEGELGPVLPVDLLRFCERHALTCTIELRSSASHGEVVYRLGELVSVRCDGGTERAVAQMLEWSDGGYRFVLPSVEMPTPPPTFGRGRLESLPSVPQSEEEPAPDSSAWRTASNEALKRKAEEAYAKSLAEAKRLEEEAEAKRLADEAEAKRLADAAQAKRLADEAEAKRLADAAQAKRLADEAEAKRLADAAQAKRLADEAQAKRLADEARAKRLADEAQAKRLADEAQAKRLADEAQAKRLTDAPQAKRLTDAPQAKRLTDAPQAKRLTDAPQAKRLADEPQAKREEAARAEARARQDAEVKRKAEERRDAQAKRRLEEKQRAAEAEARRQAARAEQRRRDEEARAARAKLSGAAAKNPSSVVVRVRRVTAEYLHITVPVTHAVMKKNPEADGSYQIDTDALFAEAVRVARAPNLAWKPEGEPVVEAHPIQKPPGTPFG